MAIYCLSNGQAIIGFISVNIHKPICTLLVILSQELCVLFKNTQNMLKVCVLKNNIPLLTIDYPQRSKLIKVNFKIAYSSVSFEGTLSMLCRIVMWVHHGVNCHEMRSDVCACNLERYLKETRPMFLTVWSPKLCLWRYLVTYFSRSFLKI